MLWLVDGKSHHHLRPGYAFCFPSATGLITTVLSTTPLLSISFCNLTYRVLQVTFSFHSVNVTVGDKEDRMMITGLHTVVDIFCVGCGSIVGWKYVSFCF